MVVLSLCEPSIVSNMHDVISYIDSVIPVLSSGVLDESRRRFDRIYTTSVGHDEFVKLRQEMAGPSVGSMDNGPGTKTTPCRIDMNPTILIAVAHLDYRCICMQRQVTCL
jgi:hypothetical protein